MDAGTGFPCKLERDLFIDDAAAHRDRVGGMGFRAVAFGNRCGNATLGPGAGGAFAKRGRRDHGNGVRTEFQRTEQASEAATDDDDIVCCG